MIFETHPIESDRTQADNIGGSFGSAIVAMTRKYGS